MKLYAYNNASESAKALSVALGIKRIKHEGGPIRVNILLNWGCSDLRGRPIVFDKIINTSLAVSHAVNKLVALHNLSGAGVQIPEYVTTKQGAHIAMYHDGIAMVCRTKLTGHSGEGIVIANTMDELVDAPLYTQYIKKKEEYRLHVMHNEVFFVQRKARKMDVPNEDVNWQVRNLAGGFIYANQNVDVPEEAKKQAIMAVEALGLDFGAVDIILGVDHKYYVLEVNTACGLAGTTLDKYVEQFKRYEN